MNADRPREIVLVGGGHAHVHVLKELGERPPPGVRLTLVTREIATPYSGMLPGHIAGLYGEAECHIDLRPLARFAAARLVHGEAVGLDRAARKLRVKDGGLIGYDLVSFDIGSTARLDAPGAAEHAVPVRPVPRFLAWVGEIADRASARPLRIAVAGGGAGGVELVLSLQHRLATAAGKGRGGLRHSFVLATSGRLMEGLNARVALSFRRILAERGIALHEGTAVAGAEEGALVLADGRRIACEAAIWVTGPGAPGWLKGTALKLDEDGFIAVDEYLRSPSDRCVFAAGDVATIEPSPRPKAGVFAVRQGPPLAENLRRAVLGEPLRPFRPQRHFLSLIGTGGRYAVASRGPFKAEGRWVWWLKEWIDRRWIEGYQRLAATPPRPPEPARSA